MNIRECISINIHERGSMAEEGAELESSPRWRIRVPIYGKWYLFFEWYLTGFTRPDVACEMPLWWTLKSPLANARPSRPLPLRRERVSLVSLWEEGSQVWKVLNAALKASMVCQTQAGQGQLSPGGKAGGKVSAMPPWELLLWFEISEYSKWKGI